MTNALKTTIEDLLFFKIAFVIFCIYFVLTSVHSSFLSFLPKEQLANMLRNLSAFVSYLYFLKKFTFSFDDLLAFLFLILLPIFFKVQYVSGIYVLTGLILVARRISFDIIVDHVIKFLVIMLAIIVPLSVIGIIPNEYELRSVPFFGVGLSRFWGFHYYSTPAYSSMTLVILLLYKTRNNCSYKYIGLLVLLSMIAFFMCFARLQFIIDIMIIIGYVLSYKLHIINFEGKIWKYIAVFVYPFMSFLVVFLSFSFIFFSNSDFFETVNEWSNTRMMLNIKAFMTYDVNLWGNLIEIRTRDLQPSESYFYIDSGYVSYLLSYGLVFYIFLMIMYGRMFYNVWKYKCKFLYIVMLVFSFANISNNFLMNLISFPVILLMFTDFSKQECLLEGKNLLIVKLRRLLPVLLKQKKSANIDSHLS